MDFINSLYDQFGNFNITFIKIDNRYNNAFISRRMTQETYYLDSDVIVYKDLYNLYNSKFNGKFVLGQVKSKYY